MDDPSTRRSAAPALICRAPYGRDSQVTEASPAGPCEALIRSNCDKSNVHDLFSVRNMFSQIFGDVVLHKPKCATMSSAVGFAPGRLRSLWDMLTVDVHNIIKIINNCHWAVGISKKAKGRIAPADKRHIAEFFGEIAVEMRDLDVPVALNIVHEIIIPAATHDALGQGIANLVDTLSLELKGRLYFRPLRDFQKYYEQTRLFGPDVFDKFSSANEDIAEAGTCLALERGTACVMHLNRVVEVGLEALATTVGVSKMNDWGSYLREIDKKLEAKVKSSGARSLDEQFYAEAAESIDNMRRAWRNPTMHPEKTYSPERAEEILQSVRSFMRHLATKLRE
jgi:hypothetical protein